ncbi:DUF2911 domain-containing protein [Lutibacter sp. TH_r2]|uniref:DUF2911 domain-containing protein n=1 Tax=Lutibacter sp. TH_r2 TaxID=3082083 RepID=UPI0029558131|nr:DUF2911 domain-containing protein [Lutibacter sp. TH_r2]MDV7187267.1 DUF2911 domain-containing protein [Lutibacter sp. TH_r2]
MLKKFTLLLLIVGLSTAVEAQIKTPQPSPTSKLEQVVGLTDITLEYSRPGIKGRVIFGNLVPFGKVWRTGANANTKITFGDNITVAGQELKKGTYAIYTIPNKDSWDIIFYSDTNNWGNPKKWDESKVAAKATVKTEEIPFSVETFTIDINGITNNGARLEFIWEKTWVGLDFEVPTEKITSRSIDAVMNGPSANDYFQAATYYHTSGKDLNKALEWMKKATAGEDAKFWHLRRMSLIQADLGDKAGAIATAKKSLAEAEKAGNADYVKMNKESIAAWQK